MPTEAQLHQSYELAKAHYAELGVDVDRAIARLLKIAISIHCWQGDDVRGFENAGSALGGGLAVTGNYPGAARSPDELRRDFEKALTLIPGKHRINLHAIYGEFGGAKVDRTQIDVAHFSRWIDWAKSLGIGIDFNPTCFAHPRAADGFTLTHRDPAIRQFWIEHCIASRKIAAAMGAALGTAAVNNIWIPDGFKDSPVDRKTPRELLRTSLDAITADAFDTRHMLDAVEGKLFGIGTESYTAGSHEFYLGYAIKRGILLCLDAGHFHPTESIADKVSSVMCHLPEILLHVSRGVRWDSDHVVVLNDDLRATAEEIVRGDYVERVHIGLDYFDASINRVAAWTIGVRCMQKALLLALLEPIEMLRRHEISGDYTARLALLEECKTLPAGAVWDWACHSAGVPVGARWMDEVKQYERTVLSSR
ncbi:MAG TPA: L-rhamnose isomerase [Tepidisphaeraceae bacterium]|nr:L-rhamnose isomerase [Tepidisphaeraceae bacterium]